MTRDAVTVIIPTRHRPSFLTTTVRSIQTAVSETDRKQGPRVRILVCDDAPESDDTRAAAAALGVDYALVPEHDGRQDPGAAIVKGVSLVDTRYQAIFGDDDIMLPQHIDLAWKKLQSGHQVVSSSFQVTDEDLNPMSEVILRPAVAGDLVAGHSLLNDGSFVEHDLVKDLEWDVSLEGQMLLPIWTRLSLTGHSFGAVDRPTWLYRRHDANISNNALSEHDIALRTRARGLLQQMSLDLLGYIPPSPHSSYLAEQEVIAREVEDNRRRHEARRPPHGSLRYRVRNKAARVMFDGNRRLNDAARWVAP